MPEDAVMTISSHDGRFTLPPLTIADNNPDNEYWTPPVPDSEIKISIEMDAKVRPMVENGIILTSINVGYRGFYDGAFDVEERSGSCNYDVECDESEGWGMKPHVSPSSQPAAPPSAPASWSTTSETTASLCS